MGNTRGQQDALYGEAAARFGAGLARLARGYEANGEASLDLEQDIHVALWKSFADYRGEASLATWVWRIAHNAGIRHVQSETRAKRSATLVPLDSIEVAPATPGPEQATAQSMALERIYALIHTLRPADRQVMLLYLEELDAAAIGEITGLSPGAVATRIHRIKAVLARRINGEMHHE